ncbi:alpha/beta hydrolase [Lachnoclostridium edouardi]|uniref:alpha/beta hydrolase n=1 Tax=Lachnoclostridium edouardi TaxID=1926283 RepID=UPI000C7CD4C5|nr:alpha/beta fold hydrolase [Lachnoclostridium edouardi]
MRNQKWMRLAAMAAAGMVFVTGCGSSAGTSASTTAVQTESSTEAESAESENTEANSEEADENTETADNEDALVLADQGMFSAGGITVTSEGTFDPENHWEETGAGQTAHVDHANVFYQIPENETGLPMVFLHGYGQSRMGWMTTPDGREGWSDMFLKKGHGVFLIDEPRRGEAGATSVSGDISTKTLDQRWYTQFRIGRWEDGKSVANEGSQFPNDDVSVDQFFRQMTPDTGMTSDMGADFDGEMVAQAVAAAIDEVYEMTGKDSVLVTHSQGGRAGWLVPKYTAHVASIIAIEPGGGPEVDTEEYQAITEQEIPVAMYFGDYIDNGDPEIQATAAWQGMRQTCYDFAEAYTALNGTAEVIDLPKEGITGNDHFLFQDLNNDVIADHVENWIQENVEG